MIVVFIISNFLMICAVKIKFSGNNTIQYYEDINRFSNMNVMIKDNESEVIVFFSFLLYICDLYCTSKKYGINRKNSMRRFREQRPRSNIGNEEEEQMFDKVLISMLEWGTIKLRNFESVFLQIGGRIYEYSKIKRYNRR